MKITSAMNEEQVRNIMPRFVFPVVGVKAIDLVGSIFRVPNLRPYLTQDPNLGPLVNLDIQQQSNPNGQTIIITTQTHLVTGEVLSSTLFYSNIPDGYGNNISIQFSGHSNMMMQKIALLISQLLPHKRIDTLNEVTFAMSGSGEDDIYGIANLMSFIQDNYY